ncbi:hypothetical protein VYU27_002382 [Nannochloropsis oceanica]
MDIPPDKGREVMPPPVQENPKVPTSVSFVKDSIFQSLTGGFSAASMLGLPQLQLGQASRYATIRTAIGSSSGTSSYSGSTRSNTTTISDSSSKITSVASSTGASWNGPSLKKSDTGSSSNTTITTTNTNTNTTTTTLKSSALMMPICRPPPPPSLEKNITNRRPQSPSPSADLIPTALAPDMTLRAPSSRSVAASVAAAAIHTPPSDPSPATTSSPSHAEVMRPASATLPPSLSLSSSLSSPSSLPSSSATYRNPSPFVDPSPSLSASTVTLASPKLPSNPSSTSKSALPIVVNSSTIATASSIAPSFLKQQQPQEQQQEQQQDQQQDYYQQEKQQQDQRREQQQDRQHDQQQQQQQQQEQEMEEEEEEQQEQQQQQQQGLVKLSAPESIWVPPETAGHALPSEFPCSPADCSLVWRALGCYTCLRTLSRFLAVSPFPALALLRGMCAPQRSMLLDEIHVQLLRVLARGYKGMGGMNKLLTPKARCSSWAYLDRINWPVYFHFFLKAREEISWATWGDDAEVLAQAWDEEEEGKGWALSRELAAEEWQRTSVEVRVGILEWLCNRLMDLPEVGAVLGRRGLCYDTESVERARHPDGHMDTCAVCTLGGDLVLCDACPAVYHYGCVGEKLQGLPATWLCPECRFPDPAYFAARVPEHYCRVVRKRGKGDGERGGEDEEEGWSLRVVHGFVFKQVMTGSRIGVQRGPPQLLNPGQVFLLLKQLGPERASRWPFSQIRRPPNLFPNLSSFSSEEGKTMRDGGKEEVEKEEVKVEINRVSLQRSVIGLQVQVERHPLVPKYIMPSTLDVSLEEEEGGPDVSLEEEEGGPAFPRSLLSFPRKKAVTQRKHNQKKKKEQNKLKQQQQQQEEEEKPKRPRGRPRKHPLIVLSSPPKSSSSSSSSALEAKGGGEKEEGGIAEDGMVAGEKVKHQQRANMNKVGNSLTASNRLPSGRQRNQRAKLRDEGKDKGQEGEKEWNGGSEEDNGKVATGFVEDNAKGKEKGLDVDEDNEDASVPAEEEEKEEKKENVKVSSPEAEEQHLLPVPLLLEEKNEGQAQEAGNILEVEDGGEGMMEVAAEVPFTKAEEEEMKIRATAIRTGGNGDCRSPLSSIFPHSAAAVSVEVVGGEAGEVGKAIKEGESLLEKGMEEMALTYAPEEGGEGGKEEGEGAVNGDSTESVLLDGKEEQPVKRKRGRPPKKNKDGIKRGPGRPRKVVGAPDDAKGGEKEGGARGVKKKEETTTTRSSRQVRKPKLFADIEEHEGRAAAEKALLKVTRTRKAKKEECDGNEAEGGESMGGGKREGKRGRKKKLVKKVWARSDSEWEGEKKSTVRRRGRGRKKFVHTKKPVVKRGMPRSNGVSDKKMGERGAQTKGKGKCRSSGGAGGRRRRVSLASMSSDEEEDSAMEGESEPEEEDGEGGEEDDDYGSLFGGEEEEEEDDSYFNLAGGASDDDSDDDDNFWLLRGSRRPHRTMSAGRKQQLDSVEEEERERWVEEGVLELADDPDDCLANTQPDIHRYRVLARAEAETDAAAFNPFLYTNKYKFSEAPDAPKLALNLFKGTWRPRFAFPIRPVMNVDDREVSKCLSLAIQPLPQVAHLKRLEDRAASLHLETLKDMLLQLESELRGLLYGPWVSGSAVINGWCERVYCSMSVRELGRMTSLLIEFAHPRAFWQHWHATRAGGFNIRKPTELGRAPLREPAGLLVGESKRMPRLVEGGTEGGKGGTEVVRGMPVRERKRLEDEARRRGVDLGGAEDWKALKGMREVEELRETGKEDLREPVAAALVSDKKKTGGMEDNIDAGESQILSPDERRPMMAHKTDENEDEAMEEDRIEEKGEKVAKETEMVDSDEDSADRKKMFRVHLSSTPHSPSFATVDSPQGPSKKRARPRTARGEVVDEEEKEEEDAEEVDKISSEGHGAKRRLSAIRAVTNMRDVVRKADEEEEDEDEKEENEVEKEKQSKEGGIKDQEELRGAVVDGRGLIVMYDVAELSEPLDALSAWGGRVFELGLDDATGEVELQSCRHVKVGGEVVERMRIRTMRGGRRCHRWEERAALPRYIVRRMARRTPFRNASFAPPLGVSYPSKGAQGTQLPRVAMSHLLAYRVQHARTSAELGQLLRVLDHCLDHERMKEAASLSSSSSFKVALSGVIRKCRPVEAAEVTGEEKGDGEGEAVMRGEIGVPMEYLYYHYRRRLLEEGAGGREGSHQQRQQQRQLMLGSGEWVHEDSLDLRLLQAYRRSVVDEANATKARAFLRRKSKAEKKLHKLMGAFQRRTHEYWKEVKEEFWALQGTEGRLEEVSTDVSSTKAEAGAPGSSWTSESNVEEAAKSDAGQILYTKARAGWLAMYEDYSSNSLAQQKKIWRLERRPEWEIEVKGRTYREVNPEPQVLHDWKELCVKVKAEVRAGEGERRWREASAAAVTTATAAAATTAAPTAAPIAAPTATDNIGVFSEFAKLVRVRNGDESELESSKKVEVGAEEKKGDEVTRSVGDEVEEGQVAAMEE